MKLNQSAIKTIANYWSNKLTEKGIDEDKVLVFGQTLEAVLDESSIKYSDDIASGDHPGKYLVEAAKLANIDISVFPTKHYMMLQWNNSDNSCHIRVKEGMDNPWRDLEEYNG